MVGILIVWVSTLKLPDFKSFTERKIESSTKIYDRTGKIVLYDVHQNIKRTVIPYEDMGINIKNATVAINVTSYSRYTVNVTLAAIDDLPSGGITFRQPGSIFIAPGESRLLKLELSASQNASLPADPTLIYEGENKLPVGLWLESEGWRIGQGFYLKC